MCSSHFPSYGIAQRFFSPPLCLRQHNAEEVAAPLAGAKITRKSRIFEALSVVLELQKRLGRSIRAVLKEKYDLEVENIPLETPPDLRFGEIATPIAFELARKLRKAPKIIAQEIVAALGSVDGFAGFRSGRRRLHQRPPGSRCGNTRGGARRRRPIPPQVSTALVEHTSINPNKAAHIGHLRNAILGDTFVRLLRAAGQKVDVQNYIDNTGVQVADVVVGFLHLEGKSVAEVRALIAECEKRAAGTGWPRRRDRLLLLGPLRAHVAVVRRRDRRREGRAEETAPRHAALHRAGGNETAEIAELISTAVLRRHLETMLRLGIEYDFLPRESEILHLKFWEAAFEQLKKTGVLYFENEGKNKGCWVMTRARLPRSQSKTRTARRTR